MLETEVIRYLTFFCYGFLYMAVFFLWLPFKLRIPVWCIALTLSLGCALASNQIGWFAIIPIIAIAYTLYYGQKEDAITYRRVLAGVAVIFLSYGLGAHVFYAFHNIKVLSNVLISKDGMPFTMYLNIDKAVVGLFILAFTQHLLQSKEEWLGLCKKTLPMALKCIAAIIFLALLSGKVHLDPKLPECSAIWLINNLLFVCVAEEGFFRGFIQKNIALVFTNWRWGNWLAIMIASLLFGVAHYAGGFAYNLFGIIAGLGYGWIYQKTNQIEASILTHFGLNAIHFFFFTYPAVG